MVASNSVSQNNMPWPKKNASAVWKSLLVNPDAQRLPSLQKIKLPTALAHSYQHTGRYDGRLSFEIPTISLCTNAEFMTSSIKFLFRCCLYDQTWNGVMLEKNHSKICLQQQEKNEIFYFYYYWMDVPTQNMQWYGTCGSQGRILHQFFKFQMSCSLVNFIIGTILSPSSPKNRNMFQVHH